MPQWLTLDFWRAHLDAALYIVVGVVLFLFFLVATFPYGPMASSLLAGSGMRLTYASSSFRAPYGTQLKDVRLTALANPGGAPLIASPALDLAPAIGSALIGKPGLRIDAKILDGTLQALVRRAGESTDTSFSLNRLAIDRYSGLKPLGIAADGTLSGSGSLRMSGPDIARAGGAFKFQARGVSVRVARGMPPIRIGTIHGQLGLADGRLSLKRLTSDGADFTLVASGTITLAPVLAQSRLDLTFRLTPSASGRGDLGFLLNMLPHPPGPQPFYVRGTLAAPTLD